MENAAYIGLSRQMTLRRELDIVANNVANADTTGFKVEQLMVSAEVGQRARNDAIRPSASFVLDNGVGRDFRQGSMAQTGRTLDFAIAGEGAFFTVRDGTNGEAYTRDGAFTTDPEGRLTTKQGQAVLADTRPGFGVDLGIDDLHDYNIRGKGVVVSVVEAVVVDAAVDVVVATRTVQNNGVL